MMKQHKKCKECDKVLRSQNKSNLCSYHYRLQFENDKRKENRK